MASCGSEGIIAVGIEADGPGHGGGVQEQEVAELGSPGEDGVGGQQGGGKVMLGVEGVMSGKSYAILTRLLGGSS